MDKAPEQSALPTQVINGRIYTQYKYTVDESWGPKHNPNIVYLLCSSFSTPNLRITI